MDATYPHTRVSELLIMIDNDAPLEDFIGRSSNLLGDDLRGVPMKNVRSTRLCMSLY